MRSVDVFDYTDELIKFFATKDMDVEVESKDFNSHSYKAQQCSIDIKFAKKTTEQRAKNIEPICFFRTIAHFELITMPGCCGIVISTNCWVLHSMQSHGIGQFLHKFRIKLAKEWGYGIMMCTDVAANKRQLHILEKNNWQNIFNFNNPRTLNDINIHVIKL